MTNAAPNNNLRDALINAAIVLLRVKVVCCIATNNQRVCLYTARLDASIQKIMVAIHHRFTCPCIYYGRQNYNCSIPAQHMAIMPIFFF